MAADWYAPPHFTYITSSSSCNFIEPVFEPVRLNVQLDVCLRTNIVDRFGSKGAILNPTWFDCPEYNPFACEIHSVVRFAEKHAND